MTLTGKTIHTIGPGFADHRLTPGQIDAIRHAAGGARLVVHDDPAAFRAALADADIAAGQLGTRATLPQLGRLSWFHTWSAGVDGEPAEALLAAGVQLTNSKGNGAIPIAEYTLMAMLMIARNATSWLDAQRQREWRRHTSPELCGSTLGLIGLGHIGTEIARRAAAFGMRCIAVRRSGGLAPPEAAVAEVLPPERLMDLLTVSDFVVVAAPLTPQTHGLLKEEHFRKMKPQAYYISVSRGAIADPGALQRALEERWVAGAVLDAHAVEPLPPQSPFWDLPNTIVTPHNAGTTQGTADRAVAIFAGNLRSLDCGEPLCNVVDISSGY